jgi:hypothetical protein
MSAGVIGVILGIVLGGAAGYVLGVNVGRESVHVTIRIKAQEEDDGEDRNVEKARGAETEAEV